jgi:hypothetical protein
MATKVPETWIEYDVLERHLALCTWDKTGAPHANG